MLFLLLLLSLVAFVIIQLPPGNIVSQEVAQLRQQSIPVTPEVRRALERAYGSTGRCRSNTWAGLSESSPAAIWGSRSPITRR